MTKIGKGEFRPPNQPDPNVDLKKSVAHFKKYLQDYDKAINESQKEKLNEKMESELSLMDIAAKSATRKETRVQEQKVSNDFLKFQANPVQDNLDILKQDVDTLGESLNP